MTRYYGWYASRTRGGRRRQATEGAEVEEPVAITEPSAPGFRLPAPGSRLPASGSRLPAIGFYPPPPTNPLRH